MSFARLLTILLFPGGLLLAAVGLWPEYPATLPQLRTFLQGAPWPLLAIGVLLAWRFNRIRLLRLLLLLAVTLALTLPIARPLRSAAVVQLWPLLLPVNLLLLALLPEWGILSWRALAYPLLLVLQLTGLLVWNETVLTICAGLLPKLHDLPYSLAFPALVTLLLAWRFRVSPQPLNAYVCWLPAVLWTATLYAPRPLPLVVSLVSIGAAIALLEGSYAMAYRDDLTGLPGRRALNEALTRLPRHYSVAMVDIDHFKQFNDKHGHDVGDQVLKMVAARLATVRCSGRACRYGGEEFAILFPGRGGNEVAEELERLRGVIEASRFVTRRWGRPRRGPQARKPAAKATRPLKVTVSIGLAARSSGETPEAVIKRADQALYRAKRAGRNQVMGG